MPAEQPEGHAAHKLQKDVEEAHRAGRSIVGNPREPQPREKKSPPDTQQPMK